MRQSRPTIVVYCALVGSTNESGLMEICGFVNDSGIFCESSNFEGKKIVIVLGRNPIRLLY